MIKYTISFLMVLLFSSHRPIDEPRLQTFFVSEYKGCVLKYRNKKWEMFSNSSVKAMYSIPDSGYVWESGFISSNCANVAFIDDYPTSLPLDNHKMLVFFTNGEHRQTYCLSQLISNASNITRSIGHYHWLNKFGFEDEDRNS